MNEPRVVPCRVRRPARGFAKSRILKERKTQTGVEGLQLSQIRESENAVKGARVTIGVANEKLPLHLAIAAFFADEPAGPLQIKFGISIATGLQQVAGAGSRDVCRKGGTGGHSPVDI